MNQRLYFKNLDASRFFAFILVFLAHCFISTDEQTLNAEIYQKVYQWGKVGILGLEYFFVLSAFLISIIILREKHETNEFSAKNFLVRRALRVWPLYFLIVVIGYVLFYLSPLLNLSIEPLPPLPNMLFFWVNFYMIDHGSEFLFFIAFLWSISVEEQFYILWSVLMKFIHRHFSLFCWTLILSSLLFRFLMIESDANLFFNTVSAFGNFGIGGLLAVEVDKNSSLIQKITELSKSSIAMLYLIFFVAIAFFHQLMQFDLFRIFERLIFSLFFAFIIAEQALSENSVFKMGKIRTFDYLGKISYGLYCFHGVVITILLQLIPNIFPEQSLLVVFLIFPPIIFAFTFLISHLSYQYFESYFLRLKNKFYTFEP